MGYHVTIVRTEAGKNLRIAADEVRAAVGKMDGLLAVQQGVDELRLVLPALGDESEVIVCEDDALWAKNPDPDLIAAMIALAGQLGARVRGDEFETYRSLDDTYIHPDDEGAHREMVAAHQARLRAQARRQKMASSLKLCFLAIVLAVAAWRALNGGA